MDASERATVLLQRYLAGDDDGRWLPGAVRYLDRNSLWLRRIEDSDAADPMLILANDAVGYRVRLSHLKRLWNDLQAGQAIDWNQLEGL